MYGQQAMCPLGMPISGPLGMWSPAQPIDTGLVLSLPSIQLSGYHTGPSLWTGLERDQNGDPFIDLNKWIGQLEPQNTFRTELELQTLAVHWRKGKHQLGIHHGVRSYIDIGYPKELAELLTMGNAPFIGETLEVGPELQWNSFHELGLSYAYHQERWSAGVRVKRLQGLEHLRTEKEHLSLYTDPEFYQLEFDVDYLIRQAGILNIDDDLRKITLDPDGLWRDLSFGSNGGWAVDIGARAILNDQWSIDVAALDLGKISWDRNTRTYSSKGNYVFDGLDIKDIIDLDTLDLDAQLDTLREKLNFQSEAAGFSGALPVRLTASLRFRPWQDHLFSLNGAYRTGPGAGSDYAIALQWNASWTTWLNTGVQYAVQNGQYDHLGLNLFFDLCWVQLYAWTDNLLHWSKERDSHVNGGAGMLITFR